MSLVQIRHIKKRLEDTFKGKIDLADYASKSQTERDTAFLTRSQAAYAVMMLSGATADAAGASVVDGFRDNGIDAIYHDTDNSALYLVQSKWHADGTGAIAYDEMLKFVKGIGDLVEMNYSDFNPKVTALQATIEQALSDIDTSLAFVTIHTGTQAVSPGAYKPLLDYMGKLNDTSTVAQDVPLIQKDIYEYIERQAKPSSITLEVMIHEWGQCKNPYHAYYGQVEAADIAEWYIKYGQSLFDDNLRKFTGRTDVNNGIVATLANNPERFWYFNNGITLLCKNLNKKVIGGKKRESGVFVVDGASVVNGAQTVGCIAEAYRTHKSAVEKARVNVRFISTSACPDTFPTEVTRAANTQNRIERRDFAALDPQQERLRRELYIENQKNYVYKSGEPIPAPADGCSIDEATVALACLQSDPALTVQAKREVGKLWEDTAKAPYKLLFNPTVTAIRMRRSVEVLRRTEAVLKLMATATKGKDKLVLVHGNRFILHCVFRLLPAGTVDDVVLDAGKLNTQVGDMARKVFKQLLVSFNEHHANSYAASLFKNYSLCKPLVENVLSKLKSTA